MSEDVRRDAELLHHLLCCEPAIQDRVTGGLAQITAKRIALWTDRSEQTISDYRTGKTNIPVDFWRRILEHHLDRRIIELLAPNDVTIELEVLHLHRPATGPEFFREAVKSEGEHHQQMKYLAEMLADGRIDELDATTVQAYEDAYQKHRLTDAALRSAILNTFMRKREKAEAAR